MSHAPQGQQHAATMHPTEGAAPSSYLSCRLGVDVRSTEGHSPNDVCTPPPQRPGPAGGGVAWRPNREEDGTRPFPRAKLPVVVGRMSVPTRPSLVALRVGGCSSLPPPPVPPGEDARMPPTDWERGRKPAAPEPLFNSLIFSRRARRSACISGGGQAVAGIGQLGCGCSLRCSLQCHSAGVHCGGILRLEEGRL